MDEQLETPIQEDIEGSDIAEVAENPTPTAPTLASSPEIGMTAVSYNGLSDFFNAFVNGTEYNFKNTEATWVKDEDVDAVLQLADGRHTFSILS